MLPCNPLEVNLGGGLMFNSTGDVLVCDGRIRQARLYVLYANKMNDLFEVGLMRVIDHTRPILKAQQVTWLY